MWSDDDVADSILESISHAESVMSGRDVSDTYDRSLQVMIGSLNGDSTYDHVLDALTSPTGKQSFLSNEADDVGVMKFEDLYEDTDRHKHRNHRSRKKKKKKNSEHDCRVDGKVRSCC